MRFKRATASMTLADGICAVSTTIPRSRPLIRLSVRSKAPAVFADRVAGGDAKATLIVHVLEAVWDAGLLLLIVP